MKPLVERLHADTPSPSVFLVKTSPGRHHSGLIFRPLDGDRRFLHLAWHLALLCDEQLEDEVWTVQPADDADTLENLNDLARLVWAAHAHGELQYGLELANASIRTDGTIVLGRSHGLTCASFLMLLYENIGAPLLRLGEWSTRRDEKRRSEDDAAQRRLVDALNKHHPAHAALVQQTVGCARFRPEEVAAASGLSDRPVGFEVATKAGQDVLNHLPS